MRKKGLGAMRGPNTDSDQRGGLSAGLLTVVCLIVGTPAQAQCTPAIASHVPGNVPMAAVGCTRAAPVHEHESPTHESAPIHEQIAAHPEHRADVTSAEEILRWEGTRLSSTHHVDFGGGRPADAYTEMASSVQRTLNDVPWADSHDWVHNPPELLKELKNYKHQGMPIIHLVNSAQTVVALGLSNHGKPGLYFTRKLPF
jgi:hypothetical protein